MLHFVAYTIVYTKGEQLVVDTFQIVDLEGHFQGHKGKIYFGSILKSYIINLLEKPRFVTLG